jgi:alkylhydroperoxidase family enzyme
VLKAMRDMAEAIERGGLVDSQLRSLVYLRVALLNGCPF